MTSSKVTLITGGSSGIGAATARQLLEQRHRVAITGRRRARLDDFRVAQGDPGELLTLAGDAADWDAVSQAVESTVDHFGQLDTVVANAGYVVPGGVSQGDPQQWRDMVLTNVLGPALLIRAALPHLRTSRGRIVLLGSIAGLVHTPDNLYGATKWAVTGLAENVRRQVTGDGIGVTLISPGATVSDFWEPLGGIPDRDMVPAETIAESIVWAITQPAGVDVNAVTVRPVGQAL